MIPPNLTAFIDHCRYLDVTKKISNDPITFRACLAVVENSPRLHTILQTRDAGVKFLEVVVALSVRELRYHDGDLG